MCIYKFYIAESLVREFRHVIAFSETSVMLKLVTEFLLALLCQNVFHKQEKNFPGKEGNKFTSHLFTMMNK